MADIAALEAVEVDVDKSGSPIRLAMVGCGRFGEYLGEFIESNLPAVACCSCGRTKYGTTSLGGRSIPGECVMSRSTELIGAALDDFDAGLVMSPNGSHCADSIALLSAGRHVFCEKPMALTSAECEQMVKVATAHGLCLMVGHKRRLRPAWGRLIELVHGQRLGEVRAVNVNGWHYHPDIPDWWLTVGDGGGILHRAGVHDIDFCNAMLGDPTWVDASVGRRVREASEFPEVIWLAIGYESGAVAGLQVSLWFTPTHSRESFSVQVLGTAGAALLESTLDEGQLVQWGSDPGALNRERYDDGYEVAYSRELSSFVAWISSGEQPILTWREGWQTVRIMEAAYQSAADHRRVILSALPTYP